MKKIPLLSLIILISLFYVACNQTQSNNTETTNSQKVSSVSNYGGFESQIAWGKHLVIIGGCNDCHTPKKMGPKGPEDNLDLELSGSPAQMPIPDVDRKDIESKGLAVVSPSFTSFIGPWGVSFAANITSDSATGIGALSLEQFKNIFKTGKYNGSPQGRDLLPPMPWQNVGKMTDDELEAVYAYLQSTKPINNVVPQPQPPVTAMKK
ncbi:MAG: c-type cytochrome [Niabella sp.]|nr:MAG: c-type cytochrome [Niabella sp.]